MWPGRGYFYYEAEMKTGYQKRHAMRIQLALDLCLEMQQKLHEKQEALSEQTCNEDLNIVTYLIENIAECAEILGIHTLPRLDKIEEVK